MIAAGSPKDALFGFVIVANSIIGVVQELRAKKIGHLLVDSAVDRPWSQYFCCMFIGNRELIRTHPVAVKRVLRKYGYPPDQQESATDLVLLQAELLCAELAT